MDPLIISCLLLALCCLGLNWQVYRLSRRVEAIEELGDKVQQISRGVYEP